MTKEINPKSIGYEQGLLAGYTKSIVLLRHMQRTLSPTNVYSVSGYEILEEAMELISEQIKPEEVKQQ